MRTAKLTEHGLQVSVFQWAEIAQAQYPELRMMFAIPNGGQRNKIVAAKLKAEGVRAGVLDVFLAVSRNGYHGLWIEHKVGKNTLTKEQAWWYAKLKLEGYQVVLSRSFERTREAIMEYLSS